MPDSPTTVPTTHTIDAGRDAGRLDLLVAQALDLSRNQAATLIADGHVLVAGRREKASYKPREGEQITVKIPEQRGRPVEGEDIPLDVVFEDGSLAGRTGAKIHEIWTSCRGTQFRLE